VQSDSPVTNVAPAQVEVYGGAGRLRMQVHWFRAFGSGANVDRGPRSSLSARVARALASLRNVESSQGWVQQQTGLLRLDVVEPLLLECGVPNAPTNLEDERSLTAYNDTCVEAFPAMLRGIRPPNTTPSLTLRQTFCAHLHTKLPPCWDVPACARLWYPAGLTTGAVDNKGASIAS
jgi:hypothetical protein